MKKNKIWMAVVMLMALASCAKTEYHFVDDSLKEWFVDSDKANFQVRDQNGITQQFHFQDTTADMIPGWSYFLFVKTGDDLCENIHQNGQVTYFIGSACSLNVTNYYETSTYFSLCFYDLQYYIDVEEGVFTCTRGGDVLMNRDVDCSMELLDSHEVNGKTYYGVMHFRVTDWDAVTRTTFPTELYYAKHYGPIEYELGGNVRIKRL